MPGPACSVCIREDVDQIDSWLAAGKSVAAIARHFGMGEDSLHRHKRGKHGVPPTPTEAEEDARTRPEGDDPLTFATKLRQHVTNQYLRSLEKGDARSAAAFARESRLGNQQLAELRGDVLVGSQVNIGISAGGQDNLDLAIRLLRALEPWPAARTAVMAELTAGGIDGLTVEGEPLAIEDAGQNEA